MKKVTLFIAATLLIMSCSTPVGITSWKNPNSTAKISKIVVMSVFDKLTYIQPMEKILTDYFNQQQLPAIKALDFLDPFKQYDNAVLKQKLDSIGADAILILSSQGKDVSLNYTGGYYGGYRGAWAGAGGWSTSTTYNLRSSLYNINNDQKIWAGDLTVTDPNNLSSGMQQVAQAIYADWVKNQVLKNPPPPAK